MHVFKHPKYYKELRKLRNKEAQRVLGCLPTNELHKSDQAISYDDSTESQGVRPGPGPKRQATSVKPQAASNKLQASSNKPQASGQASSNKR